METKQKEVINFFKDKEGKVIGRMPSGKIAIIDYNYKGGRVQENESWEINIIDEQQNKCIVKPVKRIRSSDENSSLIKNGVEKLKEKFGGTPQSANARRYENR